jgi:molybdate transport system regulatory protein
VWLEDEGRVFGDGPAALLDRVQTEGSLSKAAASLHMPYTKAWLTIRAVEERLGVSVLKRRVGGRSGGGSTLTASGVELLRRYQALRADADQDLQRLFDEHFAGWMVRSGSSAFSPRNRA